MEIHKIESIEAYIALFPHEVQAVLQKIRLIVKNAAPQATEAISYQMPTFKFNGNLLHFAAYKKHIGFYPTPSAIAHFKEAIQKYKWAKGSVQFPLDKPIPYDLIREITLFRVEEQLKKRK